MKQPAPARGYAIQWRTNSGVHWIDMGSVSTRKRDALKALESPNATDAWKRELRRRRRTGAVKAVPVVVLTQEAYRALLGEDDPPPMCRRDVRTLDLFDGDAA